MLDINENSISSFPIFDKVNVSISNLNNKTKNKHSRGKGMRSKGMRIRKAKGIRKQRNQKNKETKKKKKIKKITTCDKLSKSNDLLSTSSSTFCYLYFHLVLVVHN